MTTEGLLEMVERLHEKYLDNSIFGGTWVQLSGNEWPRLRDAVRQCESLAQLTEDDLVLIRRALKLFGGSVPNEIGVYARCRELLARLDSTGRATEHTR